MSPLFPLSAQLTYTIALRFGSTAMESVEPMRSCPKAGALDHGIATFFTTTRPGSLSDGSFNARKGFVPVAAASSRTTTTSLVAVFPSNFLQPKNAAYTVPSLANAGRTDGPSCPAVLRASMGMDLYVAPPSTDTFPVIENGLGVNADATITCGFSFWIARNGSLS